MTPDLDQTPGGIRKRVDPWATLFLILMIKKYMKLSSHATFMFLVFLFKLFQLQEQHHIFDFDWLKSFKHSLRRGEVDSQTELPKKEMSEDGPPLEWDAASVHLLTQVKVLNFSLLHTPAAPWTL